MVKTKKGKNINWDDDTEKDSNEISLGKKEKKSKKDKKKDDFGSDNNNDDDDDDYGGKGKKKKVKKVKGKGKYDDDDNEEDHEVSTKKKSSKKYESDEEMGKPSKKKDKKKSKRGGRGGSESDDDDVSHLTTKLNAAEISKKQNKVKNSGDSIDDEYVDDYKKGNKSKTKEKSKKVVDFPMDDVKDEGEMASKEKTSIWDEEKPKVPEPDKGGKKSKKSKKKRDEDDDEDIEKMLAELELEYSGLKPKEETKPNEPSKTDEKPSKKEKAGKKGRKEDFISEELRALDEMDYDYDDDDIPVKPKEKKKKPGQKEEKEEKKTSKGGDDDDKGKKKKKDSEKDKDKDKDKGKVKKGPGSKAIAAMQEALKKIKEEEERLEREEQERIKREEEAAAARREALRLEKEKKEKKKQKEKERKERLKAEGKLLTAKQKADKLRAQEMINALKAQGLEIPDPGEKKIRPGTRIKPNKSKSLVSQNSSEESKPTETSDLPSPERIQVEIVDTKVENKKEEEEEGEREPDDVKDTWDAETSEDEETSEKTERKTATTLKHHDSEEESESEEDDDEDDDDEEEEEEESSEEEESESEDEHKTDAEKKREKVVLRIEKRKEEALKNRSLDVLRAAVVCVLGHVDTGKTKILDKLRRTHVQDGEAGGITQQIGATNVPIDNIKETCKLVKGFADMTLKIPGLLIIDTPGHESFSNLRSRGSSLCDIAILVVDIMHGLEPQTLESINLLKTRKTPFIVALNKIDRLYDWQTGGRKDIRDILKSQASNTQLEFQQRTKEVIVQFAEQGLNAALFFENPDLRSYVSLVPTSAITGEGMGNLLGLIVEFSQTMLAKRLMYSDLLLATVLEVKAIPGLGTTIDCILINGKLKEGSTIVLAGTDGPIVTQIRSLLMPQPMKEFRVKNAYLEYKEVKAAQGVKIAAKDLEKAIAGLNLQVAEKPDEIPIWCEEVSKELKSALSSIKLKERGVYVQASTLGSLEALLEFLKTSKIPYSGIKIGPVVKKDVMKASIMLEHESQYATILAFDVKIERDAQELADSLGVKIFQADIIYHLFDKFMAYREELKQKKRDEFKSIAVFPCKLRILPQFVFNTRDPIVVGVMVEAGIVKEGTVLCVPSKEFINVGIVTSVEVNHKPIESARKGMEVCIKIENMSGETPKLYGRHFDHTDLLMSKISRQSIDACKDYFRDDLTKQDWQLMVELKKLFQIL
ncbi:eukaryotic translation initiation factor 5B, putative [Pediculus humanus corporis]|uniref:Eukaryotic translation initiation factor 5B n=2 Tax=Pediculus humanus subsp. corporis TaxID=121224 RepID=E0VXY0_PEDHC|nr:eukaryotic translation initiation factor 5B, putative [Pediculus humanus corporis]EEB18236.1 eukaryotic translation initiation factor 5B, putative [Pediculus humanus corporis]